MTRRLRPLLLSLGFVAGMLVVLATCSGEARGDAVSSFVLSARRVLGLGVNR